MGVVDGPTTTPTGFDARGERLWSLPSSESMLCVVVGDGEVVTIAEVDDEGGASLLNAYSG